MVRSWRCISDGNTKKFIVRIDEKRHSAVKGGHMDEVEKSIYESLKQVIKVAGHDVSIDASNLAFNEATLNEYMQTEGAKYNYYGQALADAQAQWQLSKLQYDV